MNDFTIKKQNTEEDSGDEGGTGGFSVAGQWSDPWLDKPLSLEEIQLMQVHEERHAKQVQDAKALKAARQLAIETRGEYRQGQSMSRAQESAFSAHPLLSSKAQFSGIDKEESPLPSEFNNEANEEAQWQHQLRLQNQLTLEHRAQPKATLYQTPKPSPR